MLWAQVDVPNLNETAKLAGETRGYEAMLVVVVIGVLLILFMLIVKWSMKSSDTRLIEAFKREERMAGRINDLENIVQNSLMQIAKDCVKAIQDNTQALARLIQVFDSRLCVLDSDKQDAIIDRVTTKIAEAAKETMNG